jgi:cyclic pyranopterin phosphate synthase
MGEGSLQVANPLLGEEILEKIGEAGTLLPVAAGEMDGPAVRYRYEGARGEIGLIRPMSHHFCGRCNRLRLTASGHLRPCLLSDRQEDVKGPLRGGCTDDRIAEIFLSAIRFKPISHCLEKERVKGRMSAIGG